MVVTEGKHDNTIFLSVSDNFPNCAASAVSFACIGIITVDNPLQKRMNNLCVRTERISGGESENEKKLIL
jgi:hypothetical protein